MICGDKTSNLEHRPSQGEHKKPCLKRKREPETHISRYNINTAIIMMYNRLIETGDIKDQAKLEYNDDINKITSAELIDMPKKYMKRFLTLDKNLNGGNTFSHISCAAMMLRFGMQKDELSQRIMKQMMLLTDMATYHISPVKDLNEDVSAAEQRLQNQCHHMLEEDGMVFIPLSILDKKNKKAHALYGIIKRNGNGALDLHIQDVEHGQKSIKAELRGDTDTERLRNMMHIVRARAKYKGGTGNLKEMLQKLNFKKYKGQNKIIRFDDIVQNIEESAKGNIWGQTTENCHISALHNALSMAARLNEETPEDSGIPKIKDLTPETMAKDVQRLIFTNPTLVKLYTLNQLRYNAKRRKAERLATEKAVEI